MLSLPRFTSFLLALTRASDPRQQPFLSDLIAADYGTSTTLSIAAETTTSAQLGTTVPLSLSQEAQPGKFILLCVGC